MGWIMRRGGKLYLRYTDADGTRRNRLARGATTLAEARPMLAEIEQRIMRGQIGIAEPVVEPPEQKRRRTITVRELGELFLIEYTSPKGIKSIENYRRSARTKFNVRIYPELGHRRVSELTSVDLERARDRWLSGAKPGEGLSASSVKQTLALLSKMLVWGRRVGYVDADNVAKGVERPPTPESLDYLSKVEVGNLLVHLEAGAQSDDARRKLLYPMVAVAVYAGLRKGELFGLRWIDVHEDAHRIDVMRSYEGLPKSGKTRSVPIHPALAPILRAWRKACPATSAGLVFPVRGKMGSEYELLDLEAEYLAAGCHLPAKVWHCLRHTFASSAVMAGASLYDVQKLLGHSTPSMTQIYAKLAPDHLLAQVARMSFVAPTAITTDISEERRRRIASDG